MKELITQIQNKIEASDMPEEEKRGYIIQLEAMKDLDFGEHTDDVRAILEEILSRVEKNPEVVKEFLGGFVEAMSTLLERGTDGLLEKIEQYNQNAV